MARIGVDVGGTNTDLVLECHQGVFYHKLPTTLEDQSIGVIEGILTLCEKAGISVEEVETLLHGTTTATNITIEHNGAECGMLTTDGFRDILHIGRHKRPHNFSLHFDVPWQSRPLVRRRNRIPIMERISPPTGEIEIPLDEAAVREACALFRKRGIRAVVIGFLFSFLNDAHEVRAREIVLEEMPDVFVSISSEISNTMREYERFSTAAMNSYVGPPTSFYLRRLQKGLEAANIKARLRIMQSNGGVASVEACCERPVNILMSGPAGGVMGGLWEGAAADVSNIITVDIGGTSADIAAIVNGEVKVKNPRDTEVGGYPVMAPMIDLVTIGAGGGSIARVDEFGAFHVGPNSAGSMPGPACYGRGGAEPTVTDAHIVLGRLDPNKALDGRLALRHDLAEKAILEKISQPLGISVQEAALGIIRVIDNNMALAIRSTTVARGLDPREFAVMPFGGAGPLHGVALAEAVGASEVIVPVAPGITAAVGLLRTGVQYEHVEPVLVMLPAQSNNVVARLESAAERLKINLLNDLSSLGEEEATYDITLFAECRYAGQGFELRVPLESDSISLDSTGNLLKDFHAIHHRDYGYSYPDAPVEVVSLRARGKIPQRHEESKELPLPDEQGIERAFLYFKQTVFDNGQTLDTPRYDRTLLYRGEQVRGPALLIQQDATTLVPPGYTAKILPRGGTRLKRCAI
jgi:N-methylhydantoinase A